MSSESFREIVQRYLSRADERGVSRSQIFEEVGVDKSAFYRAIRPSEARNSHLDLVMSVLEHPACGMDEEGRAHLTLAYLYMKAEVEGAGTVTWSLLQALGKELGEKGESSKPFLSALRDWASRPPPEILATRRGPRSRAAKKRPS